MRYPGPAQVAVIVACLTLVPTGPRAQDGKTRHYYIAAEDGVWDFAPGGRDQMHGGAIPRPWTRATRWTKARYVEYTDETLTTKKPQPPWLGILGPIIRAEVGDTVVVHFWNRTRLPRSVHPHGVRYTKEHEGAAYHASGAGARVLPGRRYSYSWTADEGSGPGPADPSSIVWWYHSHVNEPADVNDLLPGSMATADMVADNPGAWLMHCHVAAHASTPRLDDAGVHGDRSEPQPPPAHLA